ncbi:MAG: ribonuclease H-like domain-containing protein [Actinobacteria bacterium]|nr:ribonuclease H-like domain-containing protein [Actinomycetota bacterium]
MSIFERLNSIKNRRDTSGQEKEKKCLTAELPGGREITGSLGRFLLFESTVPGSCHYPPPAGGLTANLKLIRGIGPVTEERLKKEGLVNLDSLLDHPRWGSQALLVKKLIEEKRAAEIRGLGAPDRDLLSFFSPQDIVFLDIESTGLWSSQPLFLIGLLYWNGKEMEVQQFFARHYSEEKALLEAVHRRLKAFGAIATFNGKRFDIPYIEGRSVEHRLFHRYHHFQVDLLHHARRHFSPVFPDCRLATLEERVLGVIRKDDIPGHLIPETYHRFIRSRDPGLILPVISHNKTDLLSMARLFYLVGEKPVETAALNQEAGA